MNCKIERKFILFRNITEKKSLKIEFFPPFVKKKRKEINRKDVKKVCLHDEEKKLFNEL